MDKRLSEVIFTKDIADPPPTLISLKHWLFINVFSYISLIDFGNGEANSVSSRPAGRLLVWSICLDLQEFRTD